MAVTMLGSTLVFLATLAGAGRKSPAPGAVGGPRLLTLALMRLKTQERRMTATQLRRGPMASPAFLRLSFWSAKRLAILIGFVLTALGTLGPQFYVSSIEDQQRRS